MLRHIPDVVEFSGEECGEAFVSATDVEQAEFLIGMIDELSTWRSDHCWSMQCRGMCRHLDDDERQMVAIYLRDLLNHLECDDE